MANFCGSAGQFGVVFFVPLFFQAVQGLSATQSGLLLVPAMLAGVSASLFGGWVIKRTGKFYAITIISYGTALLSLLPISLSVWFESSVGETLGNMMSGLGIGCGMFSFPRHFFLFTSPFSLPPSYLSYNKNTTNAIHTLLQV